MVQWIPCGAAFIEADVIRWTEPVWKPKAREKSRAGKIGVRQITARVVEVTREGWVRLIVKQCVTTNAPDWWKPIPDLEQGREVRRHRRAIERGSVERLPWSDEGARTSVAGGSGKFSPESNTLKK